MSLQAVLPARFFQRVTDLYPHRFAPVSAGQGDEVAVTSQWRLAIDPSCGPLTRLAASDLTKRLHRTFGIRLSTARRAGATIDVRIAAGRGEAESYQRTVSAAGVTIVAQDDEAGMRALFHLGWEMTNRRTPTLKRGTEQRRPKWALRFTSPLEHKAQDHPRDYLSIPHDYLLNMSRYGYNASFIYFDWFDYMTPQVAPKLARDGYRKRLKQLSEAATYFREHGIRLFAHLNMLPLERDHPFFKAAPKRRGAATFFPDRHCLCSSDPQVLSLYETAAKQLFSDAPDLGGAILIVGGECFMHCFTRPVPRTKRGTHCPRCAAKGPAQVISNMVNRFSRGVRAASDDARVIAWAYSGFSWGDEPTQVRMLEKLHPKTDVLEAFEKDSWIDVDGKKSFVFDYSITRLQASERFKMLRKATRRQHRNMLAKLEISQSIEMFNVPRIPIMHRWMQRMECVREADLKGVHTTWRFYGFCGQRTDELVHYYCWADKPDGEQFLGTMARRDFGDAAVKNVIGAWRAFSRAFDDFPYSAGITGMPYFRGPFYIGPAHPMVFDFNEESALREDFYRVDPNFSEMAQDEEIPGLARRPLFFLDMSWTLPFGPEHALRSLKRVSRRWDRGIQLLAKALPAARGAEKDRLQEEADVALCVGSMFHTAMNLLRMQMARQIITQESLVAPRVARAFDEVRAALSDELANARQVLPAIERDPSLGFGCTYGIAFNASMVRYKIEQVRRELEERVPTYEQSYYFHLLGRNSPSQQG